MYSSSISALQCSCLCTLFLSCFDSCLLLCFNFLSCFIFLFICMFMFPIVCFACHDQILLFSVLIPIYYICTCWISCFFFLYLRVLKRKCCFLSHMLFILEFCFFVPRILTVSSLYMCVPYM